MADYICAIVLACYNESSYVERCLKSCLAQDTDDIQVLIHIADDGSTDDTAECIQRLAQQHNAIRPLYLEHGERGNARHAVLQQVIATGFDYLLLIDCDMVVTDQLIANCITFVEQHDAGAIVVPEWAFSEYQNYWTLVKVFERNTVYHSGDQWADHSIEGARFWSYTAYQQSLGFNPKQIAFEDIQPTLRYRRQGGTIARITTTHILHDEKHVTLQSLFQKKAYYFSHIPDTVLIEKLPLRTVLIRWYFFRPMMYRPENLWRYIKHPLLALGMFFLYISLSIIAAYRMVIKPRIATLFKSHLHI